MLVLCCRIPAFMQMVCRQIMHSVCHQPSVHAGSLLPDLCMNAGDVSRQMLTLGRRRRSLDATPVYKSVHPEDKERARSAAGVDTALASCKGPANQHGHDR